VPAALSGLTILILFLSSCGGVDDEEAEGRRATSSSPGAFPLQYDSLLMAEDQQVFVGTTFDLAVVLGPVHT